MVVFKLWKVVSGIKRIYKIDPEVKFALDLVSDNISKILYTDQKPKIGKKKKWQQQRT